MTSDQLVSLMNQMIAGLPDCEKRIRVIMAKGDMTQTQKVLSEWQTVSDSLLQASTWFLILQKDVGK